MIYTAFCTDRDQQPTTVWIDTVECPDGTLIPDVETMARQQCRENWEYDNIELIHCLGLAKGDVEIVMWEDL